MSRIKDSIFDQQECDLLTYGGFDPEYFKQGVNDEEHSKRVSEGAEVFRASSEIEHEPPF